MQLQENVSAVVRAKGSLGAFAYDVSNTLGIEEKAVSGTLHALTARGILRREKVRSEAKRKAVWRYWFVEQGQAPLPLAHTSAEELAASYWAERGGIPSAVVPAQSSAGAPSTHASATTVGGARWHFSLSVGAESIEMSYAEARTLYDTLHVIFGER